MQITVKFANPAGEGKKFGSIVGGDGVRYPVAKDLVGQFQKGWTYDVSLEEQKWGDKLVTIITGINSGPTPSTPPAAVAHPGASQTGFQDRWWLPFCSNQIHALIQAQQITNRAQLNQWLKDLKEAVQAVDAL
jgi:hypothetical protein